MIGLHSRPLAPVRVRRAATSAARTARPLSIGAGTAVWLAVIVAGLGLAPWRGAGLLAAFALASLVWAHLSPAYHARIAGA